MWVLNKIPKVCHFYWSNTLLSYLRFLTLKTFSIQNPNWILKFYYPKVKYTGEKLWNRNYPSDLVGKDYTQDIKNIPNAQMIEVDFEKMGIDNIPEVYKSDLLRLHLLSTEGGLWSDMDILYFKPMDLAWFNNSQYQNTDTIISYHPTRRHYSIGFLGSSVNNSFYAHLYNVGKQKITNKGDYQWLGIMLWHSCFQTPKDILNTYPNLNIIDIQMDLCYSIDSTQIPLIYEQDVPLTNPKTIAFHWYAGHPKGPIAENTIIEGNPGAIKNTITSTIRRILG